MALWPAAGADAAILTCGQTVTQDVILTADVENCPGDGLVIGADNVRLNLNGHTVSGTGPASTGSVGVRVDGFDRATVLRGRIENFDVGIQFQNSDVGRVRQNRMNNVQIGIFVFQSDRFLGNGNQTTGASQYGLWANGATRSVFEEGFVRDSDSGIRLEGGTGNTVRQNTVRGGRFGYEILGESDGLWEGNKALLFDSLGYTVSSVGSSNTIKRNLASGRWGEPGAPISTGYSVQSSNGAVLHGNRARRSTSGFATENATNTTFFRNVAEQNAFGIDDIRSTGTQIIENRAGRHSDTTRGGGGNTNRGISLSESTNAVVRGNSASSNGFFGIFVSNDSTGALLQDNVTNLTQIGSGIFTETGSVSLGGNTARRNADFGIAAAPGATDLGGNRASGNGVGQCAGVSCTP